MGTITDQIANVVGPATQPVIGQPGYAPMTGTPAGVNNVLAQAAAQGQPSAAAAPSAPVAGDAPPPATAAQLGLAAPPPSAKPGIMGVISNFISQNPNTFAGNIISHGLMGARQAQMTYPYRQALAVQAYNKGQADILEQQAKASSEFATAGKAKAETGEAQVLSDEAQALAAKGLFKDKDGNLRGTDANGKPFTAYEAPTQLMKSNHLLEDIIDKRNAAFQKYQDAVAKGDKGAQMAATVEFDKQDELATNIKDSARAYAASAEGQQNKMITEAPELANRLQLGRIRADAAGKRGGGKAVNYKPQPGEMEATPPAGVF